MKVIIFAFLTFTPFMLFSQVTVEPIVNLTHVWLSVDDRPKETEIVIENNTGLQHGLGFAINAKLFNKFDISLQSQFSQINNNGKYEDLSFTGDGGCNFVSAIHRWDNAVYSSFFLMENISIGIGGHGVYQPSILGNFFGRNSQAYRALEVGLGANLKMSIKYLTLSIAYYHGIQNKGGLFYYYDPIQSLGLKLGYTFELKRK